MEFEGVRCPASEPLNPLDCCNVRGTIIESEGKVVDVDYSVYFKLAADFWIYISSNIGVRTLYLSDPRAFSSFIAISDSVQLARC